MPLTTAGRASSAGLLKQVRLTETERRVAEHYLDLGERAADAILDAVAALSTAVRAMERALRALAGSGSPG